MKKVIPIILAVAMLFSGCGLWMDGSYYSYEPHLEENIPQDGAPVEVHSYNGLLSALLGLVQDGAPSGVVYISGYSTPQLDSYMILASKHIMEKNAIGAYAVEDITYEIGTTGGKPAIAVNITYHHNRAEILRIKQTDTMEDAFRVISGSLENCDTGVVLYIDQYEQTDFVQYVQDYVDDNPQSCMEMPQVVVNTYPEEGRQRVVEMIYTYQTSRDTLRSMQQAVEQVFESAKLYINEDADDWEKYSQLHAFLMERYDYKEETSITPTYSLLRHGVGDCKAFANVYAAMCRQAGLDCQTVSGARSGKAWTWNVICVENVYYHIDLLINSHTGGFNARTEAQMMGYVWDYSAFQPEPTEP